MRTPAVLLCLCAALSCAAQDKPAAAAGAATTPADAGGPPQRGGEARVQRSVSEDDAVRIDELRVRGITRSVVVQSKLKGAPAYEIGINRDGRDASQDRRSEGRSLWQLFAF